MRIRTSVSNRPLARFALTTSATTGLLLLVLASGFSSVKVLSEKAQPASAPQSCISQQCHTCPQPQQQTIYAPFFDVPAASGSEVILNSRSPHVMDITPTFYTAEGVSIVGDTFQLSPAEIRTVDVKSLIPARDRERHNWGGISFSFVGNPLEMWAQLRLLRVSDGGSVDVFFSVLRDRRSDVREAVWLMPPNSTAILALANLSQDAMTAAVQFSDGDTREVQINPFATKYVRYQADSRPGSRGPESRVEAVKVLSSGVTPSGLIAGGLVTSADGSFSSSIRFYDTPNAVQPNLFATNFRLRHVTPHLVLKNTGSSPVSARPRFLPMTGDNGSPVELPAVNLAGGEAAEVDLSSLVAEAGGRSDLEAVSIQVVNDGAPGSLIGAVNGIDKVTGLTYDIPLRDSGALRNSTGAYPWRIDKDFSTVVSVTNPSDKPSAFIMQINYPGGPYVFNPHKLAAGETATVDLRKIRDEQIPDNKGNTLPRTITSGQIRWSIHGANSARLLGRSEMLSVSRRISSSYSCNCDCPHESANIWMDPGSADDGVGAAIDFKANEIDYDCSGNPMGPFDPGGDWYMSDYSIASMSYLSTGGVEVTGTNPGYTSVNCDVSYEMYTFDGSGCVDMGPNTESMSSPMAFVKVLLALSTFGSVSTDNAGRSTYSSVLGTTSLGTFFSTGTGNRIWRVKGVEFSGQVIPSDYTGTIRLRRTIVEARNYSDNNPTPIQTITGQDDTSDPSLRDDDPQSGGSGGVVYDLDAPGIGLSSTAAVGTIRRTRINFVEYAVVGNSVFPASDFLPWFSRESVIKTSGGDQLLNDIFGDNDAANGTTNLTLNLQ